MKRLIFFFILSIFLFSLVGASSTLGAFKKDTCFQLYQICDNCTYVNLTSITYPNATYESVGKLMTRVGEDYNYAFCKANLTGEYFYNTCGDKNGKLACEKIDFDVNSIGLSSTDARSDAGNVGIIVLFGISLIFFIAFIFTKAESEVIKGDGLIEVKNHTVLKWSFFLISMLFFMITINTTFISIYNGIGDSQLGSIYDKLAMGSSYAFWLVFGLLIFIWVFATLATLADKKRMRQAEETGGGY